MGKDLVRTKVKAAQTASKEISCIVRPILKHGLTTQQEYNYFETFVRNTNKIISRFGIELGLSLKVTIYEVRNCFASIQ